MIKIVNGEMRIFGMEVPKLAIAGLCTGLGLILQGNTLGGVYAILIGFGGQKLGDTAKAVAAAFSTPNVTTTPSTNLPI
jgi:hypothetical protein